jgi:hypothetical protein
MIEVGVVEVAVEGAIEQLAQRPARESTQLPGVPYFHGAPGS